jgi:hypothetical protein
MLQALRNVLRSKNGKIIFSIIWGLGLACLFRKVCKGRGCIIYRAPAPKSVEKNIYKFNEKCYQYTPRTVSCEDSTSIIEPEDFSCVPSLT